VLRTGAASAVLTHKGEALRPRAGIISLHGEAVKTNLYERIRA
jgi:hypothetical protein